jgi:hypothetical protein
MKAKDVVKITQLLEDEGIEVWLDGGWGGSNGVPRGGI